MDIRALLRELDTIINDLNNFDLKNDIIIKHIKSRIRDNNDINDINLLNDIELKYSNIYRKMMKAVYVYREQLYSKDMNNSPYYTVRELSHIFNISAQAVNRWDIPHTIINGKKSINEKDVSRFVVGKNNYKLIWERFLYSKQQ